MAYIDSIDEPTGNVPVEVSRVQDTSANTVVAFDYNGALAHLSEDARAKYLADVSREIDIDKPVTIRSYGQEITNSVDKIADKIIDKTRSDKDIVVADLTNNLLIELEQLRVPQEKGGFVSFLKRLPGVRYLVRKTREAVIENGMMGKNVRDIKEKFVATYNTGRRREGSLSESGCPWAGWARSALAQLLSKATAPKVVKPYV